MVTATGTGGGEIRQPRLACSELMQAPNLVQQFTLQNRNREVWIQKVKVCFTQTGQRSKIQTPKSRLSGFGVWGFAAQPFRMCCTTMLTSVVVYKFLDAKVGQTRVFQILLQKVLFSWGFTFPSYLEAFVCCLTVKEDYACHYVAKILLLMSSGGGRGGAEERGVE